MKIYKELGLQDEFDTLNKIKGYEEYNPSENVEKYKEEIFQDLEQGIEKDTVMIYQQIRNVVEITDFFITYGEDNPDAMVQIINDNAYLLCNTWQEIEMQGISIDRKLESCRDDIDKKDIINSMQKRYQDLVEEVSRKISVLFMIYNIKYPEFNDKDYNNTLFNKINKMKDKNILPFLTSSINRLLRNKISHFDCHFNIKKNNFYDSEGEFVCSMQDFVKYNIDVAAIHYGFVGAINIISLLAMNEMEAAQKYYDTMKDYLAQKN